MVLFGAVVLFACLSASVASAIGEQSGPESRIVSGWVAREGQFPYVLYVRGVNIHGQITACAGSLIHARWGLSSGRCTANRLNLMIRGGMVNIHRPRVYLETSTFFTAPEFLDELQAVTQPHDIALIRFNSAVTFNEFVQPVRIMPSADMNRNYADVRMTTAGWGTTSTWGEPTEDLNFVHMTGITNLMCRMMINNNFVVRDSTICARSYNVTGQGICTGDSGVPLTITDRDGRITQVGVGSFTSQFACDSGFPNGFIRPGHYHDWIRRVTGINFDWTRSTTSDDVQEYFDEEVKENEEPELKMLDILRR